VHKPGEKPEVAAEIYAICLALSQFFQLLLTVGYYDAADACRICGTSR